jgi:hypothetical protein
MSHTAGNQLAQDRSGFWNSGRVGAWNSLASAREWCCLASHSSPQRGTLTPQIHVHVTPNRTNRPRDPQRFSAESVPPPRQCSMIGEPRFRFLHACCARASEKVRELQGDGSLRDSTNGRRHSFSSGGMEQQSSVHNPDVQCRVEAMVHCSID